MLSHLLDPPDTPDIDMALRAAASSVQDAVVSLHDAQRVFEARYGERNEAIWLALSHLDDEFGAYLPQDPARRHREATKIDTYGQNSGSGIPE